MVVRRGTSFADFPWNRASNSVATANRAVLESTLLNRSFGRDIAVSSKHF